MLGSFCDSGITTEAAQVAGECRIARDKVLHKRKAHPKLPWKTWRAHDYSERALSSTATRYKATAAKHPPLPGFRTFRWPRPGGKKSPQLVRFLFSWACESCHAPFILRREAAAHAEACPSVYGRARAAERLRNLRKLRGTYAQKTPKGPRRTAELALFDVAAEVFERAGAPFP